MLNYAQVGQLKLWARGELFIFYIHGMYMDKKEVNKMLSLLLDFIFFVLVNIASFYAIKSITWLVERIKKGLAPTKE